MRRSHRKAGVHCHWSSLLFFCAELATKSVATAKITFLIRIFNYLLDYLNTTNFALCGWLTEMLDVIPIISLVGRAMRIIECGCPIIVELFNHAAVLTTTKTCGTVGRTDNPIVYTQFLCSASFNSVQIACSHLNDSLQI